MKIKGALLWELNSPFKVDEIDLGDPVADEVQIRVHAAGMCHSDYHLTTGATPIGLPALSGHEGAGVVTKVGKNVTGIEEGDHVILAFIPACGECQPCLKGYRSLCDGGAVLLGGKAIADGTSRVHAGSTEVSPMNLLGTFAPYMTVHKDSVVKIDKDIPFETAAIMGCAVPTGFGSATNVAQVHSNVPLTWFRRMEGHTMAKWIAARELRDTDILEFQGVTTTGGFDGIPIDKLKRYHDGRVRIDVTYVDGTCRRKIFSPDQLVMVRRP